MNSAIAIEIVNLAKEFIQEKGWLGLLLNPLKEDEAILAVNNISLQVKKGEIFCIVGPNSAGKTTLIKLLCSLILPTKGTAFVNGYNIEKDDKKVRSSIGLVTSEERSFYWRLTGRQNLYFFASLYNLSKNSAKAKIEELLKVFKIEEADKRVEVYSAGMRQRLAIVRSLLHDPQVIFMDEPTKGLDPTASQEIRIFIKEMLVRKQRKTVFFATHNLMEAEFLADRLAIMEEGKIKAEGTWSKLSNFIINFNALEKKFFKNYVS